MENHDQKYTYNNVCMCGGGVFVFIQALLILLLLPSTQAIVV